MNSNPIQTIDKIPRWVSLQSVKRRLVSALVLLLLLFGLLAVVAPSASADFSGPYALNPPDPGVYGCLAPARYSFGGWTCQPTAGELVVDTSRLPTILVLDTYGGLPKGGFFYARAAAAGTMTFQYSIAGQGSG